MSRPKINISTPGDTRCVNCTPSKLANHARAGKPGCPPTSEPSLAGVSTTRLRCSSRPLKSQAPLPHTPGPAASRWSCRCPANRATARCRSERQCDDQIQFRDRFQVHAGQLVPHPRVGLFHGILASSSPIPHQSVTPANTSPAATNHDNPMAAGQTSDKPNPASTSNPAAKRT
jgi:hypothetical protein